MFIVTCEPMERLGAVLNPVIDMFAGFSSENDAVEELLMPPPVRVIDAEYVVFVSVFVSRSTLYVAAVFPMPDMDTVLDSTNWLLLACTTSSVPVAEGIVHGACEWTIYARDMLPILGYVGRVLKFR